MNSHWYIILTIITGLIVMIASCSKSENRWEIVFDELPEASFRGISAVDDSICWVSGTGGTILRTTDKGKNWQHLTIPGADSLDFRDIEAFGQNTAVAMSIGTGLKSQLYRTENGGKKWELIHQNGYDEGFYDAIAFWDNGYGILQGDPIGGRLFILVTQDGGQNWREISREQMPEVKEGEYAFAASGTHLITRPGGHVWIGTGGVNARVLHSSDYGKTWNSVSTAMIHGEPSTGIFSLAFSNESYAVAVGGDYTKEQEGTDNIIYSKDSGKSWHLLSGTGLDFRSAIGHTGETFIAVGPSGSEYSKDGGHTWHSIKGPGFHTLDIGKNGTETTWAAGRGGRIGRLVMN